MGDQSGNVLLQPLTWQTLVRGTALPGPET